MTFCIPIRPLASLPSLPPPLKICILLPPSLHPFWAGGHPSVHCRRREKTPISTRFWVASCSRRHGTKNKQPIHPNIPPPHLTPSISSARIMPGSALLFARNRTHTLFSHTRVINNAPPSKKRGGGAQTHAIAPSSFLLPSLRERGVKERFPPLFPGLAPSKGGGILGLP